MCFLTLCYCSMLISIIVLTQSGFVKTSVLHTIILLCMSSEYYIFSSQQFLSDVWLPQENNPHKLVEKNRFLTPKSLWLRVWAITQGMLVASDTIFTQYLSPIANWSQYTVKQNMGQTNHCNSWECDQLFPGKLFLAAWAPLIRGGNFRPIFQH